MADLFAMLQAAAGNAGEDVDPDFANTVLLLHGDGTNGAQNNTFLDSSTNNFTITRAGNTTQGTFTPFSKPDGAFGIFTDSQHIAWNKSAFLALSGVTAYTIEFWMYPTAVGGAGGLVGQIYGVNVSGRADSTWVGYDSSQKVGVFNAGAGYTSLVSTTAVPLNEWTHVAITISGASGSATGKIYLNGVLDKTVTSMTTTIADVGGNAFTGTRDGSNYDYHGYLTNFRVVNGSVVYSSAFTPPTTPLTSITNTTILIYQSPRLVNNGATASALVSNAGKVTPFSPFPLTTEYSPSVNGGSGYFDGTGDNLTFTGTSSTVGSGDFTIECWYYPTVFQDYDTLFGNTRGANGFNIGTNASASVTWYSSSAAQITSGTLQLNAWNHIAFTRTSNTLRMYVNGAQTGATPTVSTDFSATGFVIGDLAPLPSAEPANGYISGLRVVTESLASGSTYTIPTASYQASDNVNTSLLCNFTNAGIFDNTGFNNLETVADAQIDTSVKKYGTGSMEFDGTGDYLKGRVTSFIDFGSGNFTIECWVNLSANNQFNPIVLLGRDTQSGLYCDISSSNNARIVAYIGGAWGVVATGSTALSTSTWYYLAFVRNGSSFKIYVDGTEDASATNSGTISNPTSDASASFQVAYLQTNASVDRYFNGYIDDLRITKGVARYTTTFTPPTAAFPNIGE